MIRCFLLLVDYGNVVRSVKDSCTTIFLHSPEKMSQSQVMFAFSQIQKSKSKPLSSPFQAMRQDGRCFQASDG